MLLLFDCSFIRPSAIEVAVWFTDPKYLYALKSFLFGGGYNCTE
jgi:hypothetical protein